MTETLVKVNVPEIATKQLAFRHKGSRRILTISSAISARARAICSSSRFCCSSCKRLVRLATR